MAKTFPGFPKKGMTFFRQLTKNNNRDWFQANKDTYTEFVREPTIALVEAVNAKLERFAPEYVADPKKALTRINRDVRFSKDKSPYNTNLSVRFPRQGSPKDGSAGFYFRVSPKGMEVVAGTYMPANPPLNALRGHIAENHKAFERILKRPKFKELLSELQGDCLKRVPRGFDPEHPAGDLLRHKQFYVYAKLPVATATSSAVLKELTDRFRSATPFVEFLDEGLSAKTRK